MPDFACLTLQMFLTMPVFIALYRLILPYDILPRDALLGWNLFNQLILDQ